MGRSPIRFSLVALAAVAISGGSAHADPAPADCAAGGPTDLAVGQCHQARAEYELAASAYERFAATDPQNDHAAVALSDAAILRIGLSDEVQAAKDASTFVRLWSKTKPVETAQLMLTIASNYAEHGDKDKARAALAGASEPIDHAPPDLFVRAHALAAQLATKPLAKKAEYAKVRAAWSNPHTAEMAIRSGWPSEEESQTNRRLGRALNAVGEATFAAAEEQRIAAVDSVRIPAFPAAGGRDAVLTFANTSLEDWLVKKKTAIERTERAYLTVVEIEPAPSPKWTIAASSAVGMMWGGLVDDMRRMPVPAAIKKDRALFKDYSDALDVMTESILSSRAKPAMEKCVSLSAKFQYADDKTASCSAWLASHYERKHYGTSEIIPPFRPVLLPSVRLPPQRPEAD